MVETDASSICQLVSSAAAAAAAGRIRRSPAWTQSWRTNRALLLSSRRKLKNCRWKFRDQFCPFYCCFLIVLIYYF